MTPLQVLQSVTAVNAEVFEYDDQIGKIKPGLLADLIVLDGNPLEDISIVRKLEMIMKGGSVIK